MKMKKNQRPNGGLFYCARLRHPCITVEAARIKHATPLLDYSQKKKSK